MNAAGKLEIIAALVDGRAWGLDKGKPRVYLPSRQDITIYIDYPDYDGQELNGGKLRCHVENCGQSTNWYASQSRKACVQAKPLFDAATWYNYTEHYEEARAIAEEEVEITDAIIGELINGRQESARELAGFETISSEDQ